MILSRMTRSRCAPCAPMCVYVYTALARGAGAHHSIPVTTWQAWLDEQLHQGDMEEVGQTLAAASVQLPTEPEPKAATAQEDTRSPTIDRDVPEDMPRASDVLRVVGHEQPGRQVTRQ